MPAGRSLVEKGKDTHPGKGDLDAVVRWHQRKVRFPSIQEETMMGERNVVDRPCVCDQAGFVDVGASQELPPGTTLQMTVGGDAFTLVNLGGRVLAIGDLCLCCGRSLSTAALDGGLLVCRGCGWKYDTHRGCVDGLPNLRIETHEIHVEDGRLMLASAVTAPARL